MNLIQELMKLREDMAKRSQPEKKIVADPVVVEPTKQHQFSTFKEKQNEQV